MVEEGIGFDLFPENPELGDTNTHTLTIYAEDAFGKIALGEGNEKKASQVLSTAFFLAFSNSFSSLEIYAQIKKGRLWASFFIVQGT